MVALGTGLAAPGATADKGENVGDKLARDAQGLQADCSGATRVAGAIMIIVLLPVLPGDVGSTAGGRAQRQSQLLKILKGGGRRGA